MLHQAALPVAVLELRKKLLGSSLPVVDLMRALNLLPASDIRVPSSKVNHFVAREDEGGHFCIYFPFDKFIVKAYPIGNALHIWRVLELRRRHCKHEQPAKCHDKTLGLLSTFEVKLLKPHLPSVLDVWMQDHVNFVMLEDLQTQMCNYCDVGMFPTKV